MTGWDWTFALVCGLLVGLVLDAILIRWMFPPLDRFRARMLARAEGDGADD